VFPTPDTGEPNNFYLLFYLFIKEVSVMMERLIRGENSLKSINTRFLVSHSTLQTLVLQYGILLIANLIVGFFEDPFSIIRNIFRVNYWLAILWEFCALWAIVWLVNRIFPGSITRLLPSRSIGDPDTIIAKQLRDEFEEETGFSETEAIVANRLRAIRAIDERIHAFRVRSAWMLLSISFLLIAAAITIIFAGSLTNLDASAASDVDRINQDIVKMETKLAQLSELLDFRRILDASQDVSKERKDEVTRRIASVRLNDATLPIEQNAIAAETDSVRRRLDQSEQLLKEAWTKQLTSEHGYSDTRYLIATAITRIGVVLIIVFLVQILIGLYRYNARLVTFYNSRRDALQLWDGKPASIEKMQKIMAPNIDFGKEPKHPLEDIMRQVVAKMHIGNVPGSGSSR
jgi:hypothetical protein